MTDDGRVTLPAASEVVYVRKPKVLAVPERDYSRLLREARATQRQRPPFGAIASASAGVAVSTGLGWWIGWSPIYAAMPPGEQAANAYVAPALLIATVASGILAAAMLAADRAWRHNHEIDRDLLVQDLEEIRTELVEQADTVMREL